MRFQQAFHGTLAVPGNATTPIATVSSSGRVSRLVGSVRCDKTVTVTVYQCPVTVGENTTWLHKTDVSVSASSTEGGGAPVSVAAQGGGGFKIVATNAGSSPADDGTTIIDLWTEAV